MSLVKKMQQGDKTPILYTLYGDQYQYNDLQRAYDEGLNEYLSKFKDKHREGLINAGRDIMAGIKDGTISYSDGLYNDSKGRYHNNEDKKRDYYGYMANYIQGIQGKSNKYVQPEDKTKIKYSENSLGQAFIKELYNGKSGRIEDFLDLDEPDPTTKKRGVTKRINMLKSSIDNLIKNYDTLFYGYTEEQKNNDINSLKNILARIEDNSVTGDHLYLTKAFGPLEWDKLFSDGVAQQEQESPTTPQQELTQQQKFMNWVDEKYPDKNFQDIEISNPFSKPLGPNTIKAYANALGKLSTNAKLKLLEYYLENPTKKLYENSYFREETRSMVPLNGAWLSLVLAYRLQDQFTADPNNSNILYLPFLDKKNNAGYYYDKSTKKIHKTSIRNIPYWQQKMYNEWSNQGSSWADKFFTQVQSNKNGGILKFQNGGTPKWARDIQDYDKENYGYAYDTSKLVNPDFSDDDWTPWGLNEMGSGEGRYKPQIADVQYVGNIEKQQYYQDFINALFNSDGSLSDVGKAWVDQTDNALPGQRKNLASILDENGNVRKSWAPKNKDTFGRNPQVYTDLRSYIKRVMQDQLAGQRHNIFLNRGKRYFYKDRDGNKHYVDPNIISKYKVSKDPVESVWDKDKFVQWDDYELTGLLPENENPEEGSKIRGEEPPTPSTLGEKIGNTLTNIAPDILGASRLLASLRTNNKVSNTLKESLKPVLIDTYERYSPVTGAFSEMQLRNRQAADVRRMSSRPLTSDARIQLAGQLAANTQATDLEHQGFLADDKEIKRTQAEALMRQEDNMARRSDVANKNRLSINQNEREKAQLEASRLQKNWTSWDNYMQGIESRLRTRNEEDKLYNAKMQAYNINSDYEDAVYNVDKAWSEKNPNGSTSDKLKDYTYLSEIRALRKKRDSALSKIRYTKIGGKLKPSATYIVNKVIKNAINT